MYFLRLKQKQTRFATLRNMRLRFISRAGLLRIQLVDKNTEILDFRVFIYILDDM